MQSVHTYTNGATSTTESADQMAFPASGQADEQYGLAQCPSWHNTVRFYRDVRSYDVSSIIVTTCDTCGGSGKVAYKQDSKKPEWAAKYRACPSHMETTEEVLVVTDVPTLSALTSAASAA